MQQLPMPLTTGQLDQARRQVADAMSDTTCLHCWLRLVFEERGLDPDDLQSVWNYAGHRNPAISAAFIRLLLADTVYVEGDNEPAIAHLLKLSLAQRAVFYSLNYRNRQLTKKARSQKPALDFCPYRS